MVVVGYTYYYGISNPSLQLGIINIMCVHSGVQLQLVSHHRTINTERLISTMCGIACSYNILPH